ncbi:MAG: DUF2807 domain-containing protein [Bacteroidales bacterium]|nr:DUF2807 domain-containing protein [Bacteroidales bacterium]MCB9000202.1 DUF2807 domain-containing protein [Bacteroidales bacterium]MCB9013719.1 DUF2807 domain-containing protein [Bacteroidales bacterium]
MKTLKNLSVILFISLLSSGLNAQDTISRNIPDFHSLNVMGKMRVELYKSESCRAELILYKVPSENIITEVTNGSLSIRLKTDTNKDAIIKLLLYYTDLSEISVSANSLVVSPGPIKADTISFIARSGAKAELDLDVKNLMADVKQGAILVFTGKTSRQDVSVNTGATYSAYKLQSEDSYVKASSGSKAKLCASRIIDATSNTKSYIGYIGTPVSVYIKTNLGGEIASFATEDAVFDEQ